MYQNNECLNLWIRNIQDDKLENLIQAGEVKWKNKKRERDKSLMTGTYFRISIPFYTFEESKMSRLTFRPSILFPRHNEFHELDPSSESHAPLSMVSSALAFEHQGVPDPPVRRQSFKGNFDLWCSSVRSPGILANELDSLQLHPSIAKANKKVPTGRTCQYTGYHSFKWFRYGTHMINVQLYC